MNMVECVQELVGFPTTVWQENCLYFFGCLLLILSLYCIFKIINYLFHI